MPKTLAKTVRIAMICFIGFCAQSANACTVFPSEFAVSHAELVNRTDNIALVRPVLVKPSQGGFVNEVTFDIVEPLKGHFKRTITRRFQYHARQPGKNALTDFDGHKDQGFWQELGNSPLPSGRHAGVGPDCVLGFYFEKQATYLAFFDGETPRHIHAFERIVRGDDVWLNEVRRLIAEQN